MKEIKEVATILESYNNFYKIEKRADKKYFINTSLFLIESGNVLPIYLVEYNGKLFFADYGGTLQSLNTTFKELNLSTQQLIKKKLEDLDVIFDGSTLMLEVINNYEFGGLNTFICAIMFLQAVI